MSWVNMVRLLGFGEIIQDYASQFGIATEVCYILVLVVMLVLVYAVVKWIGDNRSLKRAEKERNQMRDERYNQQQQAMHPQGHHQQAGYYAPPDMRTPSMRHHSSESSFHHEEIRIVRGSNADPMTICSACARQNPIDAVFCQDCGEVLV